VKPILVIADDLTGACDTGVQFSKQGLKTVVISNYQDLSLINGTAEIYVVNSNTRDASQEEAFLRSRSISLFFKSMGINRIYKKIDSTLRGYIGSELSAMMDVYKGTLALIAPAYPDNGRVVINGSLIVKSCCEKTDLLDVTENHMGQLVCPNIASCLEDEMNREVSHISLGELRNDLSHVVRKIEMLRAGGCEVVVFDTFNSNDLCAISQICNQIDSEYIIVGSAGFAPYYSAYNALKLFNREKRDSKGYMLVLIGSNNTVTKHQVDKILTKKEVVSFKIKASSAFANMPQERNRILEEVYNAMHADADIETIVITVDSLSESCEVREASHQCGNNELIAEGLGEIAKELIKKTRIKGMFLTGGATAFQVCRMIEVKSLRLLSEVASGVPMSIIMGGIAHGMPLITKAGGFGDLDVIIRAVSHLKIGCDDSKSFID
jgi:D-threonate/D-erythronate kinase